MSSTSTDNADSTKSDTKSDDTAPAVVTMTNAAASETAPDDGRPVPPDVLGGSIHRPGQAPGMSVLDGPATMTVGAHRKTSGKSGKKS